MNAITRKYLDALVERWSNPDRLPDPNQAERDVADLVTALRRVLDLCDAVDKAKVEPGLLSTTDVRAALAGTQTDDGVGGSTPAVSSGGETPPGEQSPAPAPSSPDRIVQIVAEELGISLGPTTEDDGNREFVESVIAALRDALAEVEGQTLVARSYEQERDAARSRLGDATAQIKRLADERHAARTERDAAEEWLTEREREVVRLRGLLSRIGSPALLQVVAERDALAADLAEVKRENELLMLTHARKADEARSERDALAAENARLRAQVQAVEALCNDPRARYIDGMRWVGVVNVRTALATTEAGERCINCSSPTCDGEACAESPYQPRATTEAGADVTALPCPTCQRGRRETVGMVCQSCGRDYATGAES